ERIDRPERLVTEAVRGVERRPVDEGRAARVRRGAAADDRAARLDDLRDAAAGGARAAADAPVAARARARGAVPVVDRAAGAADDAARSDGRRGAAASGSLLRTVPDAGHRGGRPGLHAGGRAGRPAGVRLPGAEARRV